MVGRVRPILAAMASEFDETTHYAVLDGNEVVYLAKVQSPAARFQMKSAIGGRNPAYCTGVGKALLAYRLTTIEAVRGFLSAHQATVVRHTPHTLLSPEDVHEEFAQIRERGYAVDREEHEEGINCIAVPLFLTSQNVPDGAVSVAAVAQRLPLERLELSVPRVREMIRELLGEVTR